MADEHRAFIMLAQRCRRLHAGAIHRPGRWT